MRKQNEAENGNMDNARLPEDRDRGLARRRLRSRFGLRAICYNGAQDFRYAAHFDSYGRLAFSRRDASAMARHLRNFRRELMPTRPRG